MCGSCNVQRVISPQGDEHSGLAASALASVERNTVNPAIALRQPQMTLEEKAMQLSCVVPIVVLGRDGLMLPGDDDLPSNIDVVDLECLLCKIKPNVHGRCALPLGRHCSQRAVELLDIICLLVLWIGSVSSPAMAVAPQSFQTEETCKSAGEVFTKAEAGRERTAGYHCLPRP